MKFIYETFKRTLPNKVIGCVFQMDFKVIRYALKHNYSFLNHRNRHPKPFNEIERELFNWIWENAENKKVINRTELLHHYDEIYEELITTEWIVFLIRNSKQLLSFKSVTKWITVLTSFVIIRGSSNEHNDMQPIDGEC